MRTCVAKVSIFVAARVGNTWSREKVRMWLHGRNYCRAAAARVVMREQPGASAIGSLSILAFNRAVPEFANRLPPV